MTQIAASTLRQRNKNKDPLTIVRSLDAFPKIPDEYKVGTRIGGICEYFRIPPIAL